MVKWIWELMNGMMVYYLKYLKNYLPIKIKTNG